MRRYFVVVGVVLGLHFAALLASKTYLGFLTDVGALLVHGNDIPDLPNQLLAGLSLVGAVLIAASVGVTYLRDRAQAAGAHPQDETDIPPD